MVGGDVVDRLRGGGLALLGVLVVAAGAGWWRAVAPAVGPAGGPAAASGADERRGPGDGARRTGSGATSGDLGRVPRSDRALTITVGPTGRVTSGVVVLDPATGRVVERYDVGTGSGEDPDGGLGGLIGTVWQARLTLHPGQSPQRRVVMAATRAHLVQYRCVGPGQLLLVTVRSGHRDSHRATCDGSLATAWLSRGNGPIRIELAAAARGIAPIVADARVAALAF
ncbi:hypothetical protein [Micromonospora rubida]|uniref:hypothetical protein n=1 Tax=Micromonospora rubida TaxID=2697657 RepID=UPI00137805AC|nr:hypothetical protein [Micromonospora rubida]NBE81137.1 hypothetical protein [Micromonospora rubida]